MVVASWRMFLVPFVAVSSLVLSSHALAEADFPTEDLLAKCSLRGTDSSSCVRNTLAGFVNHTLRTVTYGSAKGHIFNQIDVYTNEFGQHAIDSVYSPDVFVHGQNSEESAHRTNSVTFNVEHTWPQSHLKKYTRFEQTKADIFHLFPVESGINSRRGNMPFANCGNSSQDVDTRDSVICSEGFMPPPHHRGKVARAMFYMAVTYNMKIDMSQERVLRQWNQEFPVTDGELERDARIYEVQGAHNPFILHPEWAERISDF
jgi:deoxyribonuclease-1